MARGRPGATPGAEQAAQQAPPRPPIPDALSLRVIVEDLRPEIDGGRFPIKRAAGESVDVSARIFSDGHDVLVAVIRDRHQHEGLGVGDWGLDRHAATLHRRDGGTAERRDDQIPNPEPQIPSPYRESAMTASAPGTDEWRASFDVDAIGWHEYQIVAWVDRFLTWRRDLHAKAGAGQAVGVELLEGSLIVREAAARAEQVGSGGADARRLLEYADRLSDADGSLDASGADELASLMAAYADRSRATSSPVRRLWVDRERARFGAWYEMFPRSFGPDATRSGTFREAAAALPRIAALGFDVVYLPPIHPIGTSFRKGRNNALVAAPDDPGSPWAIGSAAGGHTAVDPGLGTIDDFVAFRAEAERLGMEVALDLAWQCSPDHPWVREHPEWFRHRPDGTIKYAENPPKKYQDIYPFDFENEEWPALWNALRDVARFWIDRGVRIFRVDNPHTKTFGFWEWFVDTIHAGAPDVLFLSEAFTRPAPMRYLAKSGFTQSYTYFTWRNSKSEIVDYFSELTATGVREYLRPNLFANTPDILHAYLQRGGRPAFEARLLLAATLGATYGIYSGFELCEAQALGPGSEEYADSEKYQIRARDWEKPGNINELVCRVNQIRHEQRALQFDHTLRFHHTDNDSIVAYSKGNVLVVVNLDPHHMQHGTVEAPVDADSFDVTDLLDDTRYTWRRGRNYVRLDPGVRQGHIFRL
jgi:starch synthase (maltosyl-transferring)